MSGILKYINVQFLTQMCEYLLDGEPVFIVRAQDLASLPAIEKYIEATKTIGGSNVSRATNNLVRIRNWQVDHPNRLKKAD